MRTHLGRMEAFDALLESLSTWPLASEASEGMPESESPHASRRSREGDRGPRPPVVPRPDGTGSPASSGAASLGC